MTINGINKKKIWRIIISGIILFLACNFSGYLYAQTATSTEPPTIAPPFEPNLDYVTEILEQSSNTISVVMPVVISIALLLFLLGMLKFMSEVKDSEAREKGKRIMMRGIIILFIMTAVWTLIALLSHLSGIKQGGGVRSPGPSI
jgi:heme/copper-type cytochrome/quinol oxidase subunit 3